MKGADQRQSHRAEVAELVDALGSGSSVGFHVRVRVSPSAPFFFLTDYFRIRIPDDLRLYFAGKTEIKRSLQTGYLSDAKYKTRLIAGQVQRLFRYFHGLELTSDILSVPSNFLIFG